MARDVGFTITIKGTESQVKKLGAIEKSLRQIADERKKLNARVREAEKFLKTLNKDLKQNNDLEKAGSITKREAARVRSKLLLIAKDSRKVLREESKELGRLTSETKRLSAQKSNILGKIKTENDLIKSTAGSYNRLVLENKKLTDSARKLSDPLGKNRKRFQELSSKITTNTDKLKKLDSQMGRSFRNVGNYSGALGKLRGSFVAMGAAIAAGVIAFRTFTRLVGSSVETLVVFDEAMADTAKTTQLTADQIARLTDELKKLDTPTSINGLLAIAEAGGRLGVVEKDLLGFVEVTDKVVVALGDVLGTDPEAIGRSLGKVASLFDVDETFGIAEGINKVGSALNELGAQTKATEPFLIDFALRIAGIAPLADIVIEDVLGLAATLDELGQPAETSATALGNLLLAMGRDVPTFAELAGVSIDEFSNVLREDANEALILVLDQIGKTGRGLENLAGVLEDAGIEGRRAAQIVGVLSNNTDLLRKNQDLATQSFAEGTSLTEEFNLKSETLGATWSKLVKVFSNKLLSTGLVDFLTNVVNILIPAKSLTDQFLDMRKEFEKTEEETDSLVRRYNELIGTTEENEEGQKELEAVIRRLAELVPSAATAFDKFGNALDVNTGKVIANLEQQREILKLRNREAIDELTDTIEDNTEKVEKNQRALNKGEKTLTTFSKTGNAVIETVELTNSEVTRLQESMLLLNAESADATLKLQELGIELTEDQKAFVNAATGVDHFNESVQETAEIVEETTFVTKKESESLTKQIEKNNATLLQLSRDLAENQISLTEESFDKQRAVANEAHKQEIEDLEAQKGKVVAINEAIDNLIESKEKSHQAELTAIDEEAEQDRINNLQTSLDLEQQIRLTEVAESENSEEEKQQAILDIQIEFAEKRLQLLEETGDLSDEQVRLQIEGLKQTLAELKAETEGEPSGLAGFLNVTDEEAEIIKAKAVAAASAVGDAIFTIQKRNDKRRTNERIKAINKESQEELKLLKARLDEDIISQEQFDEKKSDLEEAADKKQEAVEKKAFQREKRLALVQVGLNTAAAIVKAIAIFGPPPSPPGIAAIISAGVIGAAQALVIGTQKFKEGGELVGPSHEQGGIKAGSVEFEGGEGVINKRSMRSGDVLNVQGTPKQIASQINSYKGFGVPFGGTRKKFQLGGVAPAPNIAPTGISEGVTPAGTSLEEVAELIIEAQNAQVVRVVETDITDTQNDVAVIQALQD